MSYDDGDPNTWEGIIYRNGPDIDEDTRYAVINIGTQEPAVTQELYYPPDGGDPEPGGGGGTGILMSKLGRPGRCTNGAPAALGRSLETGVVRHAGYTGAGVAFTCPAGQHRCIGHEATGCCGPIPPIDNWMRCSVKYYIYTGVACVAAGPAWPACFTWGSLAGMIYCML